MDGTDLTCPNCGTSWKLIKAGDGPVTCPSCKAVVGPAPPAGDQPSALATGRPIPKPAAPPAPAVSPFPSGPGTAPNDADDPGIGAPPRGRMPDVAPRRGRHPLVTVAIILLLLLLVPVALCSVLWAVCAMAFR